MNILITGANGQLGQEIRLLSQGQEQHRFLFTDIQELDITSEEDVARTMERHGTEAVINCAAFTAVDRAEECPELCRKVNTLAPAILARQAERQGAWLVQISTDYVFDGTANRPLRETDPVHPLSVYGKTKAEAEQLVQKLCSRSVILRTAWLYSQFGSNFVKTMMRLTGEREQLGVVFDQIGSPTWARDLAGAILSILETGPKAGLYHYSGEGVCSWYDLTQAIARLSGHTGCRIRPLLSQEYPSKAVRPLYSLLDKTLIKETYPIGIPHWTESLERCIDQILKS